MSPRLFNIFMENTVSEARCERGAEMKTGTIYCSYLFANDLMLVTERDAERNVNVRDEVMMKLRMTINCGKRGGDIIMQQHLSEWGGDRQCKDTQLFST